MASPISHKTQTPMAAQQLDQESSDGKSDLEKIIKTEHSNPRPQNNSMPPY